ncbi:hypothetical protein CDEST_08520 [Colletotrichum destructivum]|uniref:PNPLA domain-containing protein n=1 Tax=Colletotrichum destructivum TaxID=34406 RepID=A0AAX4IK41_9PEZI|nr:hypothetical protein CDEST_08520 [Colletotrichum destructivum]
MYNWPLASLSHHCGLPPVRPSAGLRCMDATFSLHHGMRSAEYNKPRALPLERWPFSSSSFLQKEHRNPCSAYAKRPDGLIYLDGGFVLNMVDILGCNRCQCDAMPGHILPPNKGILPPRWFSESLSFLNIVRG